MLCRQNNVGKHINSNLIHFKIVSYTLKWSDIKYLQAFSKTIELYNVNKLGALRDTYYIVLWTVWKIYRFVYVSFEPIINSFRMFMNEEFFIIYLYLIILSKYYFKDLLLCNKWNKCRHGRRSSFTGHLNAFDCAKCYQFVTHTGQNLE